MTDPDLWPDSGTLAAGDENLLVEPDLLSTIDEDGHLEADDWWRRHPDAE